METQELKPLVFHGVAGTGKTTFAKVIAQISGFKYFEINASDERNGYKLLEKV